MKALRLTLRLLVALAGVVVFLFGVVCMVVAVVCAVTIIGLPLAFMAWATGYGACFTGTLLIVAGTPHKPGAHSARTVHQNGA